MLRIRYEELHQTLAGAFRKLGFEVGRALLCARFFVALDPAGLGPPGAAAEIADGIVASIESRYPGQRTLQVRAENNALGLPVDPAIWRAVQELDR